jgi:hypothetical protein
VIKLTIVYYALRDGETFDEEWYYTRPTAHALSFVGAFGCRRLEVSKAVLGVPERSDGAWPENIRRLTELWFDTIEDARGCIYSSEMKILDAALLGGKTRIDPKRRSPVERGLADTVFSEIDLFEFDADGRLTKVEGPWAPHFERYLGTVPPPTLPVEEVPVVPPAR